MSDATTPLTVLKEPDPSGLNVEISDAVTVYKGRFAGIRGPDHGTTQGYADSYAQEEGMVFGGLMESAGGLTEKLGDTGATPPPTAGIFLLPQKILKVTVAGVASRADILKPIYVTDNQTLTLTRPSTGAVINGYVLDWHVSTTCDVLLLGLAAQLAHDMAAERQLLHLGSIDFASVGNGNALTGIPMPFHGELLELFTITVATLVGSSGSILLNAEIDGTNVDGGVVTLATATQAAVGVKSAGTAITGNNVFHQGDLLDIEGASAASTRTSGSASIYALVAKKVGS